MKGGRSAVIASLVTLMLGFSLGLVTGALLERTGARPDGPRAGWPFERRGFGRLGRLGLGPGSPGGPRTLLARLDRDLDLTPAQHARILAALEHMRDLHLALRDSTRAAIERELDDPQRVRWHALEAMYQQSWHGRAGRPFRAAGRPPGVVPDSGEKP